jgi:DHA1 family bicyclomycin/chloramphenicol resistance-like MFS transporter
LSDSPDKLPHRSAPPATASLRQLMGLLIAMTAIGPMSLNILVPAIPGLVTALETDAGSVQLTVSLFLVGLALSQLVLGPLSDRFGRRPVVLAGLALTAISSAAAIAAWSVSGLVLARFVQSLGASTGMVVGRAIIRDIVDREHAAAMIGMVTAAVVVAPMVAPLLGGILDTVFGWEAIFVFVAAASFLVFVWALVALPETHQDRLAGDGFGHFVADLRSLSNSRNFIGYVLCGALTSASFFAFLGGAPHVVVTMMGRTSAEYGAWFIINSFGFMFGLLTTTRLSTRVGLDTLILGGLLAQLVGCLISISASETLFHLGPAVFFFPQFIVSYGNGVVVPNAIAGAVSVRPQAAGTASGLGGFGQMAVGAVVSQFTAWALEGAARGFAMTLTMLVVTTAGLIAYYGLVRRH